MKLAFLVLIALVVIGSVAAAPGAEFVDPCYVGTHVDNGDLSDELRITNTCVNGNYIEWDSVNLTILGNVTDGDLSIGMNSMSVDTVLRPDLDVHARMVFESLAFATQPAVFKDGTTCNAPLCNVTHDSGEARLTIEVEGFSNYTLEGRQDFTVYMDAEPELKKKTYQTVDLGDARRGGAYACIVQVFGRDRVETRDRWVLVQTNPERKVQARILGNPDENQPESLGFFPTKNGVANTYIRGGELPGYSDFQLVVQCTSNSTSMLIYEEAISTRYSPLGRKTAGRGVWLTDDSNAFYLSIYVVVGILGAFLVVGIWRKLFKK